MRPGPSDPTELYRARDGVWADDLLIAAVGWLDLFTWLTRHTVDLDGLCEGIGLTRRTADVLCTLLRAMGLVEPGDVLVPTALARDHLVEGAPYDMRPYFVLLRDRPACVELLEVLKSGRPAPWSGTGDGGSWEERLDDPSFASEFTAGMDARGAYLAPLLAEVLDDVSWQRVLDIAGGSGIYAHAFHERHPDRRVAVLERPPVDRVTRAHLDGRGAGSIEVVAGDMFGAVPEGFDLHLLSHALHDWDDDSVRLVLQRCFEALPRGGWLADHDGHLDADKCGPLPVARYSVLLARSTEGRCRSVTELGDVLTAVGFVDVTQRPVAADRSVVLARKPW